MTSLRDQRSSMAARLDWRWHQAALSSAACSVNPDAHSIPELDHMRWGVGMTRKGVCQRPGPERDDFPDTRYLRKKRHSFARAA